MSKVIWKYELVPGENEIHLPVGAKPVHTACQGKTLCIWIELCPTDLTWGKRQFYVAMTGEEYDSEEWRYFGSAHIPPYVLHVLTHE